MKTKIIYLLIATIFLLNSCHDSFLEEKVYSNITPLNFYKTEQDAQAALISVYNAMQSSSLLKRQALLAAEFPSEATWPNFSGEAWRTEMDEYTWSPSSGPFYDIWAQLYVMVNRANTLLSRIDGIEFTTNGAKEQVTGETRFLRGLAYLYLVRFFENVPLKTELNMDELEPTNENVSDGVWKLIFEDLEFAKNNLKPKYDGANVGRATSGAAQTILAKAYLTYAGKPWNKAEYWAKASQEAKSTIDNATYGYNLEVDYEDVFSVNNEHGPEYIFSVEYISNKNVGWDLQTFSGIRNGDQQKLGGWSSFVVEKEFFESMSVSDKRRPKTFVLSYQGYNDPSVTWTYPGNISIPHYNKYQDRDDVGARTSDYGLNFYITRFSDLLLMHSEAENEVNGPTANALYGINRVRERAGLTLLKTTDFTKETFREAIYQERLWELCAEGHAWFDMKRMDLMKKRITKFTVEDKHYVFPIPQNELDANPNLIQNNLYK